MSAKIALDAGHGLKTAGKQTPTGIKEWELNDAVCDIIGYYLRDYDCCILRTDHDEGATDEALNARVKEYLTAGVAAVVSIHHNAYTGSWNDATGFEVYTDRAPTAADKKLAKLIHDNMVTYVKLPDRGIKKANFQIINQNKIPAVLVEGGFMDGRKDYEYITSDAGKNAYALAVAQALISFLSLKKREKPVIVEYRTHDAIVIRWLPAVNSADEIMYAGNFGHGIDAVLATISKGNIYARAHEKATNRWLPEVKNGKDYAGNLKRVIDAVMFKADKVNLRYMVHERSTNRWLPPVTGYNTKDHKNGYAGNIGREIDGIKIWVE